MLCVVHRGGERAAGGRAGRKEGKRERGRVARRPARGLKAAGAGGGWTEEGGRGRRAVAGMKSTRFLEERLFSTSPSAPQSFESRSMTAIVVGDVIGRRRSGGRRDWIRIYRGVVARTTNHSIWRRLRARASHYSEREGSLVRRPHALLSLSLLVNFSAARSVPVPLSPLLSYCMPSHRLPLLRLHPSLW